MPSKKDAISWHFFKQERVKQEIAAIIKRSGGVRFLEKYSETAVQEDTRPAGAQSAAEARRKRAEKTAVKAALRAIAYTSDNDICFPGHLAGTPLLSIIGEVLQ